LTNHEIADYFSLLSRLMEIHGENSFKARSYSTAAYTIEKLPQEVAAMDDYALFSVRGIGTAIGEKIRELQTTGKIRVLEELLQRTPPGILELMQVKGLGPKKIAVIWKEMGIESLGELEYACQENRLALLKGFGAKSQENILQGILFIRKSQGFYLWAEAEAAATGLLSALEAAFPGKRFEMTGKMRRQCEVVDDLSIVTDMDAAALQQYFLAAGCQEIADIPTGIKLALPGLPQLVFHTCSPDRFFQTLFHTTGSEAFIETFLEKYNLPEVADSEAAIFEAAGLPFISPALRESFDLNNYLNNNILTNIISTKDIKGVIHSHSTWSDGRNSIEEMARAARDRGLEYLVISDHSQAAYYANGLSPERIAAQHAEIDALNEVMAPFRIFKSIEADILSDGSLDYNEQVLRTFDLVIASVHSNLKMSQERAMERLMKAISNPFTTILGHPTGRLLLSREGYPIDHRAVIDACAEHNVVIEINAHPRRLDLDWRWISYAVEKGVLLSIDPDAHSVTGFDDIRYGVLTAQKGGLTPLHNLSSYTLEQFSLFLGKYRQKRDNAL
jgi:DNA polymerase (family 10)